MFEETRQALLPWYLHIKAVHVTAMAAWIWSTSVGFIYYLLPAFRRWFSRPHDPRARRARDWSIDQFDRGAILEHVAFPTVLASGLLLFWVGGWDTRTSWLMLKLLIVFGIFLPIEMFDYHLAHFGGNKAKARARGGEQESERKLQQHWWFLVASTPPIIFFGLAVLFLALTKPQVGS